MFILIDYRTPQQRARNLLIQYVDVRWALSLWMAVRNIVSSVVGGLYWFFFSRGFRVPRYPSIIYNKLKARCSLSLSFAHEISKIILPNDSDYNWWKCLVGWTIFYELWLFERQTHFHIHSNYSSIIIFIIIVVCSELQISFTRW